MKKFLCLIGLTLILTSCQTATLRYSGSGNFNDLAKARYACHRHACTSAFDACVAAKGFYSNQNGPLNASSIQFDCSSRGASDRNFNQGMELMKQGLGMIK